MVPDSAAPSPSTTARVRSALSPPGAMHTPSFRRGRSVARAALALALVTIVPACTSWHRTPITPGATTDAPLDHVRLVRADGRRLELWTVRIARDTLFGYTRPRWDAIVPPTTAVPVDSVRLLEVRGTDAGRTAGLVTGVAGTGAVLVIGLVVGTLLLINTAFGSH